MNPDLGLNERKVFFSALIDEHLPRMRRIVFRIVGNAGDADDAIQQALLKAWIRFDHCKNQDKMAAWVSRIACNEAYDLLRRRLREQRLFVERSEEDAATLSADSGLVVAEMEAALEALPEHLHAAINLTIFEGLSSEEAAMTLGCRTSTLYWRVHAERKILSKKFKELWP